MPIPKRDAKCLCEEAAERIAILQQHIRAVEEASSYLSSRVRDRDPHRSLRDQLVDLELDEWRTFCMWGLTVDGKTLDRVKAAVHDRFLSEGMSAASWMDPSGVTAHGWLDADEKEFREMARKAFAPREEEP